MHAIALLLAAETPGPTNEEGGLIFEDNLAGRLVLGLNYSSDRCGFAFVEDFQQSTLTGVESVLLAPGKG